MELAILVGERTSHIRQKLSDRGDGEEKLLLGEVPWIIETGRLIDFWEWTGPLGNTYRSAFITADPY